jgi:hypothetical protein
MGKPERIYRRTESGLKAWVAQDPALSDEDLRILGLMEGEMHSDVVRRLLRRHIDHQRLAVLEAAGLIAAEDAAVEHDLDFTGSFSFAKTA